MNESAQSVLDFWFSDEGGEDDAAIARRQSDLWWVKNPETDEQIRARFAPVSHAAAAGELDAWGDSADGRLALILLVDQFRRNMYRDSPEAFSADRQAQRWCLEGLAQGMDELLRPVRRVFFYMPLEHAENLALQKHCVALFEALADAVEDGQREIFDGFIDYARRHRDIIQRFGRFPHRNAVLGRESTAEEAAFLEQPGSSF